MENCKICYMGPYLHIIIATRYQLSLEFVFETWYYEGNEYCILER